MKPETPIEPSLIHRALDAEAALAQAHEARQQGELALALQHALSAQALAPIDGLRTAAGWLACFCQFRLGQHAALMALGPGLLPQVQEARPRLELLRWLTLAAAALGQTDHAARFGSQALALADSPHQPGADAAASIAVHRAMAQVLVQQGDPWQAEALLLEALPLAESQPLAYPLLATLQQLAEVQLDQAHLAARPGSAATRQALQRAADSGARAQSVAQRVGDTHFHAFIDGLLGEALLHLGRPDEAWPRLERALCQAMAHDQVDMALRTELAQAEGRLMRGQPQAALERLDACLADVAARRADVHLPPPLQQRLQRVLGQATQALGQRERSARHLAELARLQASAAAAPAGR